MKNNKLFYLAVLPALTVTFLAGCNNKASSTPVSKPAVSSSKEEEEKRPLEIGDTVKEWTNDYDYEELPMGIPSGSNNGSGTIKIDQENGQDDYCSLKCEVQVGNNNQGYISSDAVEKLYFTEDDAKNGDIISLYYYVPVNSNVASLQLQVMPSSNNNAINGDVINITDDKEDKWIRTLISFDTLETLGSIRVVYTAVDPDQSSTFYIDVINIELGEETVKTDYVSNGESLYQAYEDYMKIGTCMAANGLRNTEMRKIAKENFNSITAENEGKPEQVLDQAACQEAAKTDKTAVCIKTTPFEKLYNFCEANHIGVRHHTFVWYSQTPNWFFNEDYSNNGSLVSRDTMLKRMENFIKVSLETINDRWPGLVYAIDVANEAVVDGPKVRDTGNYGQGSNKWYDTVGDRGEGDNFVYYAFKYADMYKEDYQELYYNDYSYDYNTSNCRFALDNLLKKAIEEDLVDGVGIQGHIDSDQNMDVVINDAKMIYEKGLKCQITELDITINGNDEAALNKQKAAYKLLLSRALECNKNEETDINALIVWGITDNSSWKSGQNPLLFNSNYAKKPAYYGVLEAVQEFEENN
ncbi:MAG: endo-1,4-beta-xylanase [Bacilli bacterium]|nr:endo-1,4-beta-xylanase [Bacilli bacterium]